MKNFRKLTRMLKAAYPQHKVSVRRVPMTCKLFGDCERKGKSWRIRINRELDEHAAIDTLVHEFPHVAAWQEFKETGEHGIVWAEHFRRCYRIYEQMVEQSYES